MCTSRGGIDANVIHSQCGEVSRETLQVVLKNIFEVERFSGKSVQALTQDFSGVVLLATLESILSPPAPAELTAQGAVRACR